MAFEGMYKNLPEPAVLIAGCSAVIALVLSLLLILQRLRSYTTPSEQKWVVAVIFIVPVYATESIISLLIQKLSLVCNILRNCCEAFTLDSFGRYLIACLGGERRVVELPENESEENLRKSLLEGSDEKHSKQRRSFCNFLLHPSDFEEDLLKIEKFGLMILKTVCALLACILEIFGVYGDWEFKWNYGYPCMAVVLNFSQMWALYCLVQFYNVTHERLEPIKPLAKFISFKAIVFATLWQGVGIALLCSFGVIPKGGKVHTGLQDFLICIETFKEAKFDGIFYMEILKRYTKMTIAAVVHVFVFSARPYHYLSVLTHETVSKETLEEDVKIDDRDEENAAVIEETETKTEAPGTSVKENVQDIVAECDQWVVKEMLY